MDKNWRKVKILLKNWWEKNEITYLVKQKEMKREIA